MEMKFSAADEAFRQEVRAFIAEVLPPEIAERVAAGKKYGKDEMQLWHEALYRKGWVAPGWPEEAGGTGWTPVRKFIFDEEIADASAPMLSPFGLQMVAPVIMAFGSDEQKARYLPKILSGEAIG